MMSKNSVTFRLSDLICKDPECQRLRTPPVKKGQEPTKPKPHLRASLLSMIPSSFLKQARGGQSCSTKGGLNLPYDINKNTCAAKNEQDEDAAFSAYLKKYNLEVENGFIKEEVLPKLPRRLGPWMVSTIDEDLVAPFDMKIERGNSTNLIPEEMRAISEECETIICSMYPEFSQSELTTDM